MPLLSFFVAFVVSLLLIPIVQRLSFKLGRVAQPREDRWHRKPTPTLGGIGMFGAFITSLVVTSLAGGEAVEIQWGLVAGSLIVFLLGFYDDLKRITPQAKLVGQILAASVIIFQGVTTTFFTPHIANTILAQVPNNLLTFIWLVGITNAINLLDNMDGLAGGISLIAACILSYFFWSGGYTGLNLIALALAGAILGFLIFNFPPASIFMGDSGSLFLGFTLAVLAIARPPQASNVFAVMGVPTLLFLLPILDTTLVTFTRILRGQSPVQGGRDHTSHRLVAFGLNERQAVLVLYGVALLSGLMAIFLEGLAYWFSLVLVPILVLSLSLLTAYLGGLKVVTAPANQARPITRIMLELTYRRRLLEVVLDFFLIEIVYYLAFVTRYGLALNDARLEMFLQTSPIALAAAYISFYVFGIYRGVWRYVGLDDFLGYFKAAVGCVLLTGLAVTLLFPDERYFNVLFVLFGVYLFLALTASRSSFRILDQVSVQQAHHTEARVLICGAGDTGELAVRWILSNPESGYQPVGFLDRDPFMTGRQIHGIPVLGDLHALEDILERKQVDGIILTPDLPDREAWERQILQLCRSHDCWLRSLRLEFELVEEPAWTSPE